jgi:hypothetical protein
MVLEDFGCRMGDDGSAPTEAVGMSFERYPSGARDEMDARLLGTPRTLEGIIDACDSRAMRLEADLKLRGRQGAGGKRGKKC